MFKKDGRSFQFCLMGFSDTESAEIRNLITENGGAICDIRHPPISTLTICNKFADNEIVLNVNYVRECIKHGKLLDADIFNRAVDKRAKLQESEMFHPVSNHVKIQMEHNYAQEKYFGKDLTNKKYDVEQENANLLKKSSTRVLEDITIIRRWVGEKRNSRLSHKKTSPNHIANRINPPNALRKGTANSPEKASLEIEKSINPQENDFLQDRLQEKQNSQTISSDCNTSPKIDSMNTRCLSLLSDEQSSSTSDCAISPELKSKKRQRKMPSKRTVVDDQPIDDELRSSASPVIPNTESNQVQIFGGGIREMLSRVEEFCLTSSDSDVTYYDPTTALKDCERRASVDQSSCSSSQEVGSEKVLNKYSEAPGPSRENAVSEIEEENEVSNNDIRNGRQFESIEESDMDSYSLSPQTSSTRNSDDERISLFSSPGSSDTISISDKFSSDSSSEDEVAQSRSERTSSWKEWRMNHEKRKHRPSLNRSYSQWEKQQMVNYLIDNDYIENAKGNLVWKMMLKDGYLPHRSFHSLNNHFRKFILPHIHEFQMSRKCLKQFQKL